MKIFDDSFLEDTVYVGPRLRVFIAGIPITRSLPVAEADAYARTIRNEVISMLKEKILDSAKLHCELCRKEKPRKRKTRYGLRILHYSKSLGWQPCEAESLYHLLMSDTTTRRSE